MNFITLLPKDLEFRSLFQYWCQFAYRHQLKPDARFFFHHFKLLNRSFLAELTLLRMDVHHFPSRFAETKRIRSMSIEPNLAATYEVILPVLILILNDKRTVTACAYNSLYFLRYRKGRSCLHISENRLYCTIFVVLYRGILPRLKYSCFFNSQLTIKKDCDINWGRNCFAGLLNGWTAP